MKCHDIHGHGCHTELAPDWKFCPACGRKPATVEVEATSLLFPFQQSLPVRHRGFGTITFWPQLDHSIVPEAAPLRIKSAPRSISPGQMAGLRFEWIGQNPPPTNPPLRVPLRITTDDGAPDNPFSDNAVRSRARTWPVLLDVKSPIPGHLHIEQEIAIFHARCGERTLQIENRGDVPLHLTPFQPPPGYAAEPDEGEAGSTPAWTIAPHARRRWKLRALDTAPLGESTLTVWDRDLRQRADVRLLRQNGEKVEAATTYVVGVDFGTSGTSVWLRSGTDLRAPAFALKDTAARRDEDPLRFPTEIFIHMQGGVEAKDGFTIGYEARQASETHGGHGLFVRELKNLLRSDEEPYVADYGPQYTVDNLLQRYLKTLKAKIIEPALTTPGATVAWNFSIPVLDGHRGGARVLFERQKSRLEKAIRAAGFLTTGCTLQFFTEPYCAAVYLLLEHGKYRFPPGQRPQDGDWACVFDSGGGTTDVVLGRLYHAEGRLQFEEVSTLGGYRDSDESRDVNTFGGEALTRLMAIYLTFVHDYLKFTAEIPYDPKKPELRQEIVGTMIALLEKYGEKAILGQFPDKLDKSNDFTGSIGSPPIARRKLWCSNWPLLREVDGYKRRIARLPAANEAGRIVIKGRDAAAGDKTVSIKRSQFDTQVVDVRLKPLKAEMDRSVFKTEMEPSLRGDLPQPVDVRWVFGVGGNCRVRRISEDWLPGYFMSGVQNLETLDSDGKVDDSDRMLAVSGGTVWASQARRANALPYRIWVADEDAATESPVFEVFANDALSDTTVFPECNRSVPTGQEARFGVWIEGSIDAGRESLPFRGRIGSFALVNADYSSGDRRNLTAHFRFQDRKLLIEADETGGARTVKFEYAI